MKEPLSDQSVRQGRSMAEREAILAQLDPETGELKPRKIFYEALEKHGLSRYPSLPPDESPSSTSNSGSQSAE